MEQNNLKIKINDEIKEYPQGTTLWEISQDYKEKYKDQIMLAFVDHKLSELRKPLHKDCEVRFVTIHEDAGYKPIPED